MTNLFNKLDALLVTNPTNIRYLTGFAGVSSREREAYALLTQSQLFLLTNSLYREEAQRLTQNKTSFKRLNLLGSLASKGLTFLEISRGEPFAKKLDKILKRLTLKQSRLGFEGNDLTVAEFGELKKELRGTRLIPTKNRVEELRMIKREDEIENIRLAAKLTDTCFASIGKMLKPGVSEAKIAWEIETCIRNNDAQLAFSPIVAFGNNTSQPHYHIQHNKRLKKQDIVLLDFGARVNGYCADMTRVIFVGKPKNEWICAYKIVIRAQEAAIGYLRAQGRALGSHSGRKADRIARTIIKEAGFPAYTHSLGHGVGLAIHEASRLTIKKEVVLKPGMIITVEPGIYIEGQYGIRIEDVLLIKENDIEVLSSSTKQIVNL